MTLREHSDRRQLDDDGRTSFQDSKGASEGESEREVREIAEREKRDRDRALNEEI